MNWLEELIPLAGIVFVFGIPIVAILTAHQRKMAEIMSNRHHSEFAGRLAQELAELRDRLNQQTLMLEQLTHRLDAPAVRPVAPLSPGLASPPPLPETGDTVRIQGGGR